MIKVEDRGEKETRLIPGIHRLSRVTSRRVNWWIRDEASLPLSSLLSPLLLI
jgi:hypothetical protein